MSTNLPRTLPIPNRHPQPQTVPQVRPQPPREVTPAPSISQQALSQHQSLSMSSAPTNPANPGLRYPSNKKTIYDRNLNRSKNAELSRAAFAYLFIEMISYAQKRVRGIADLEKRLNNQGYPLGLRLLDLLLTRNLTNASNSIRPTRILPLLQFIAQTLWRHLFGRPADALERSESDPAQYMLYDNEPLVNQYISLPREMNQLNCAAFVAGIIEGVCDGAGFATESVTAHSVGGEAAGGSGGAAAQMWPDRTVFLIQFKKEVLEREDILGRVGG